MAFESGSKVAREKDCVAPPPPDPLRDPRSPRCCVLLIGCVWDRFDTGAPAPWWIGGSVLAMVIY